VLLCATKALYFTYSWEARCEQILTKFCTPRKVADVIFCANFGVEKNERFEILF